MNFRNLRLVSPPLEQDLLLAFKFQTYAFGRMYLDPMTRKRMIQVCAFHPIGKDAYKTDFESYRHSNDSVFWVALNSPIGESDD